MNERDLNVNHHQTFQTLDRQINDYLLTATGHLKKTPNWIDARQMAAYGAAAGSALVMMSQAEASVVANAGSNRPVQVRATSGGSTQYEPFDMNGDGTVDLALFAWATTSPDGSETYSSAGINYGGNGSVVTGGNVRKLASGFNIGPNLSTSNGAALKWSSATGTDADVFKRKTSSASNSGVWGNSNWDDVAPPNDAGLIGVRFQINGATHYGWVRLQIVYSEGEGREFGLDATQWAYESCPDTVIAAGVTTGGPDPCPGAGPGPGSATSVPVMGLPGLGLMGLAMGGMGLGALRRRRQQRRIPPAS